MSDLSVKAQLLNSTEELPSEFADQASSSRKQSEARKVATAAYEFRCCIICGLQLSGSLTVSHLDHKPGNNEADNLAFLCWTHHWMFDCGLYPIEAVKMMRARWQETKGIPSHTERMKDAGPKAANTRKINAAAKRRSEGSKKAWVTCRANT